MRLSVNEIQVMCQRAAAGAGVPFGLAEDCAAAAVWLATAGLDGVEVFHRALEHYLAGSSVPVEPGAGGGGYSLSPVAPGQLASALFAGPALSDRIPVRATAGGAPLCATAVDEPLLVLGYIAVADHTPPALTVCWQEPGGPRAARCRDGGWSILGDDSGNDAGSSPQPAPPTCSWSGSRRETMNRGLHCVLSAGAMARSVRRCYDEGIVVADQAYERVHAHARKMLVADSPRSRIAGAGAGLHDND